jgi:hypothetical protein
MERTACLRLPEDASSSITVPQKPLSAMKLAECSQQAGERPSPQINRSGVGRSEVCGARGDNDLALK